MDKQEACLFAVHARLSVLRRVASHLLLCLFSRPFFCSSCGLCSFILVFGSDRSVSRAEFPPVSSTPLEPRLLSFDLYLAPFFLFSKTLFSLRTLHQLGREPRWPYPYPGVSRLRSSSCVAFCPTLLPRTGRNGIDPADGTAIDFPLQGRYLDSYRSSFDIKVTSVIFSFVLPVAFLSAIAFCLPSALSSMAPRQHVIRRLEQP